MFHLINNDMDKFAVIKFYEYSSPTLLDTFDNEEHAVEYAAIMRHKNQGYPIAVYQLNEKQ